MIANNNRVKLKPIHKARLLVISGIIGSCVILVLFQLINLQITNDQKTSAKELISVIESMADEAISIIPRLESKGYTSCNNETLIAMRREVFKARFAKDIGFFINKKLVCTTGVGLLENPFEEPPANYTSAMGYEIWNHRNLVLFNESVFAIIVRKGNYNVVFTPQDIVAQAPSNYRWQIVNTRLNFITPIAGEKELYSSVSNYQKRWHLLTTKSLLCSDKISYCAALSIDEKTLVTQYLAVFLLLGMVSVLVLVLSYVLLRSAMLKYYSLETRIKRGFKKDRFYSLYQPLIELKTQKIIGCEVLARYSDSLGPLYPDLFIPMISKLGFTWSFTRRIVQRALTELSHSGTLPENFKVNFNIFPQDISNNNIAELITLDEIKQSSYQIVLEITEDQQLDTANAIENLTQMANCGFQIAIDDFGTGYSNLSQIRKFNCHTIKIDRSFVMEMEDGSVRSTLIPHIVAMAKELKLDVLAEGIENTMQLKALIETDVKFGQGWAFGKPMTAQALVRLYENQQTKNPI